MSRVSYLVPTAKLGQRIEPSFMLVMREGSVELFQAGHLRGLRLRAKMQTLCDEEATVILLRSEVDQGFVERYLFFGGLPPEVGMERLRAMLERPEVIAIVMSEKALDPAQDARGEA